VLADYSNNMQKIKKAGGSIMKNKVSLFSFLLLLVKVVFSKKANIGW
jgi:hypothetical protein